MKPVMIQTALDFLKVYLITDRTLLPVSGFLRGIESALDGGVRAIQLREKDLSKAELLTLAKNVVPLTRRYGAKLFINHHADIAAISSADGVHLKEAVGLQPEQDDKASLINLQALRVQAVKKQFPHLLVGLSTHSLKSACAAEAGGVDFITFSPIFDTPSKAAYGSPQGLDQLKEVTARVDRPVIALGGIKLDNAFSVMERGAFGIALISGIWSRKNIKKISHQFIKLIAGDVL